MFVAERWLRGLAAGVFHALKWFLHEFLLLAFRAAAGSRLTGLCRITGCLVIVLTLHAELQNGLLPNTTAALIQVGVAVLTAILFGNIAKEFAFDLCARLILWSGRSFVRNGLTVGGKTFWEIQFRDGTWVRNETGSTETFCEWTQPDGRCNRFEVRLIARGGRDVFEDVFFARTQPECAGRPAEHPTLGRADGLSVRRSHANFYDQRT